MLNFICAAVLAFQINPQPLNPYCGKTPGDFTPPAVNACHDGTMDQDCLRACKTTYKNSLVAAFNNACSAYDAANVDYRRGVKAALQAYDDCMVHATNLAEREACRDACADSISLCVDQLSQARINIANTASSAATAAATAFVNCANACCH